MGNAILTQFPTKEAFIAKFNQILATESSKSPAVSEYIAVAASKGDDWSMAANEALKSRVDYERNSRRSDESPTITTSTSPLFWSSMLDRAWPVITSHRMQGVFGTIAAVLFGYLGLNSTGMISSTPKSELATTKFDSEAIVAAAREQVKGEITPELITNAIKAQIRESVNELLAGKDGSGLAKQISDRIVAGIEPDEIARSTSRKAASAIEESGIVDAVSKRLAAEIRSSGVIEKSSARFVQDVENLHLADDVAVKVVGAESFKETQALVKKIAEKLTVQ